ncbi:hypothetical protein [Catellatospora sp. NPDC049609]|uniref:hypothetical protein n=1 Tax=Catellatospora sp. NPDC049609 TaxID=3155505 RepID=UPI0034349E60
MARTANPTQLKPGDWFIDRQREGRRPAKVVKVVGTKAGEVMFELDDNTRYGAWVASYPVSEQLERA